MGPFGYVFVGINKHDDVFTSLQQFSISLQLLHLASHQTKYDFMPKSLYDFSLLHANKGDDFFC